MTDTPNARLARVLRLLADVAERESLSGDARRCLRAIYDYEFCELDTALGHAKSYATEAALLAGVPLSPWVLVSERLPEPDLDVELIVTMPDNSVRAAAYNGRHWFSGDDRINDPIAWRPLPEPYRPEDVPHA